MNLSKIFSLKKKDVFEFKNRRNGVDKNNIFEKIQCPKCKKEISSIALKKDLFVCHNCGHYFPMSPKERIELISDNKYFKRITKPVEIKNPLAFPDYEKKIQSYRQKNDENDAVLTGLIKIGGNNVAVGILNSNFMLGSMGIAVGEEIARITEYARRKKLPLFIFSASGGARMQEGIFSLLQMAKTATCIEKFKNQGGLYISVLTNPTTGGVSASFAALGDIIIAEPDSLVCFAGPRVIEQTIGEKLPKGFQKSEYLLEHGRLDAIVERKHMKSWLEKVIKIHSIKY